MKLRILFPGRKVDAVTYRCEGVWSRGHTVGAVLLGAGKQCWCKEFIGQVF